jgi:hypothetical protein
MSVRLLQIYRPSLSRFSKELSSLSYPYRYYGTSMSPATALLFGWGASLLGFAFAAIGKTHPN